MRRGRYIEGNLELLRQKAEEIASTMINTKGEKISSIYLGDFNNQTLMEYIGTSVDSRSNTLR